jgi:hypothetical protein
VTGFPDPANFFYSVVELHHSKTGGQRPGTRPR